MYRQYKDGEEFVPKPKALKRQNARQLVDAQILALLLIKHNLMNENIADDFLNTQVLDKKIIERAIELVTLHPYEMLMRLAKTELHLETTLFLYEETYKQKQFLETEYMNSGKRKVDKAANIAKSKVSQKYLIAKQLLDGMNEKNFIVFCKKMRAKLSDNRIPASTLRKYYLKITGLESTK